MNRLKPPGENSREQHDLHGRSIELNLENPDGWLDFLLDFFMASTAAPDLHTGTNDSTFLSELRFFVTIKPVPLNSRCDWACDAGRQYTPAGQSEGSRER